MKTRIYNFTVPTGRIFYIKKCRVLIETINNNFPVVIPAGYFPVTISIDGNSSVFTQDILVNTLLGEIDTHLIAGQGQTITVDAEFDGLGLAVNTLVNGITQLIGDMLLPNDQSVPFTATAPRE